MVKRGSFFWSDNGVAICKTHACSIIAILLHQAPPPTVMQYEVSSWEKLQCKERLNAPSRPAPDPQDVCSPCLLASCFPVPAQCSPSALTLLGSRLPPCELWPILSGSGWGTQGAAVLPDPPGALAGFCLSIKCGKDTILPPPSRVWAWDLNQCE
jgi:hypothetical protein